MASSSATGYAFGKLLRAVGAVDGLERVRFTSPHPRDFTDDVIAAMAETPAVMPSLHMPLQSGSDDVLRAMRRSYRRDRYLGIVDERPSRHARRRDHDRHHRRASLARPTTISGETLEIVREARFSSAFTFQYSKRPGTPAAAMDDQVPKSVVQDRYERLVDVVEDVACGREPVRSSAARWRSWWPKARVARTSRPTGCPGAPRQPAGPLLGPGDAEPPRPGDFVTARVTYAAPHHLVADSALDGGSYAVRRTSADDVHERTTRSPVGTERVMLGMPTLGDPAHAAEPTPVCRTA